MPAWSHKLDAKERKEARREKKARKRAFLESQEAGHINEEEDDEEPPKKKGMKASAVQTGKKRALGKEPDTAKVKGKLIQSGSEDEEDNDGKSSVKEERAAKRVKKGRMQMEAFDASSF